MLCAAPDVGVVESNVETPLRSCVWCGSTGSSQQLCAFCNSTTPSPAEAVREDSKMAAMAKIM
ncbi:MAG: hypothetical protein J6Q95_04300 [Alistipes sp.]|nr:hypothetical protein [Alistipes sp.]